MKHSFNGRSRARRTEIAGSLHDSFRQSAIGAVSPHARLARFASRLACLAVLSLIPSLQGQAFTTIKRFGDLDAVTGFNPSCLHVLAGDGALYGTTATGEGTVAGTVFKVQPDGSGFAVLKRFTNSFDGANPHAGLVSSGGVLYGTTANGGTDGGTVFRLNADGTGFAVLKRFSYGDGIHPVAGLSLDGDDLYGTTTNGGAGDLGTVFKLATDGTGFRVLKHFTGADGARPLGGLSIVGGVIFGTTSAGGAGDAGTVFKVNTDGTGFTTIKEFTSGEGARPGTTLTVSGDLLYGTTSAGGDGESGTIFKLKMDGSGYAEVLSYFGDPGEFLSGQLALNGGVLYGTATGSSRLSGGTVFRVGTDGAGFEVLMPFAGDLGANPQAGVLLSGDQLYGTAANGGIARQGSVFKVGIDGTGYTTLKHFTFSDALNPWAGLTFAGDALYGTTYNGGGLGRGAVFRINLDGTGYTLLKSFTGGDGANPQATLTAKDGVLYGTTFLGGGAGSGTVFKLNSDGTAFTVLRHCTPAEGRFPAAGVLISDGVLYGTTSAGGNAGAGTVFRVNIDGSGHAVLKHFAGGDGAVPLARLTISGGILYGTTYRGGGAGNGTVFRVNTNGTGYQVLKHFSGMERDGRNPIAGLTVLGGVLYGTTRFGGDQDRGTVFRLNTDGTGYAVLADSLGDGGEPLAGVVASGGALYGTTAVGGSSGFGTLFKINTDGSDFAVVENFVGSNGEYPQADLAVVGDALFGTTASGGNWAGTVFKLNVSSSLPRIQCTNRVVECGMEWTIIPPPVVDPSCTTPGPPVLVEAVTNNAACPQAITLHWQYTNCLQQSVVCAQTVSVIDTTPPVPDCPTNKTVRSGTPWTFDPPTAWDTCWGTNLTITPAGPPETNSACPLIVEQMWFVSDGCGNPAFCSQQVIVVPAIAPAGICPTNMTLETANAAGVAVFWELDPSGLGGGVAGMMSLPPSGTTFLPDTTNTVTAWAWTECLETNSCTFTVAVRRVATGSFVGFNTGPFFSTVGAMNRPTDGTVLVVRFDRPVASETFVPITSSDPSVLAVNLGGVTIPAGQVSAAVAVTSFGPGTVTLTASHGGIESTAVVAVVLEIPARPVLSITPIPGAVQLAWTTNAVGFLLESNSTAASPAGWGVVASNYYVLGTNHVFTNLVGDSPRFFRLRKLGGPAFP